MVLVLGKRGAKNWFWEVTKATIFLYGMLTLVGVALIPTSKLGVGEFTANVFRITTGVFLIMCGRDMFLESKITSSNITVFLSEFLLYLFLVSKNPSLMPTSLLVIPAFVVIPFRMRAKGSEG